MLFAAVTIGGSAEEPNAASPEGSISAAKRELDAIRAARNPAAVEQKAELPSFTAPELQLSKPRQGSLTKRERLTREQLEAERKAKNWLIDAMEKERELDAAARDGRKGRAELESERVLAEREALRNPELELDRDDPAAIALREADAAAKAEEQRRERAVRETPVSNPLAGYMAGWMTPQDFALLQPNLGAAATDAATFDAGTAPAAGSSVAPGTALSNPGGEISTSLFGERTGAPAAATMENPYLQPLLPATQLETVLMPAPAPMPAPPPSIAPVLAPATRREEPPAKSTVPDFVRPSDDEKYFKQLKRF